MTDRKWGRPAAGREPAASAVLAWLADADAPRMCVVTGSTGCGKSSLLAWLIAHGTREGTRPDRRVHAFVPLAGRTALTAAWTLAQQLSVAARTPGELVTALAADRRRTVIVLPELHAAADPASIAELALLLADLAHVRLIAEVRSESGEAQSLMAASAVMDLDEARWTDPERYAVWATTQPSGRRVADGSTPLPSRPAVDLNDPAAVCAADPWQVSVRYERSGGGHGGLRTAWLRAGVSLTREQTPADRAVVLLAALGDDADPRIPGRLADLAGGAAWQVAWRRVRGDVRPPWPGPACALAAGRGLLAGKVLVADHQGTVRLLDESGAAPVGRLPNPVPRTRAVAATPEGDVLILDAQGRLHTRRSPSVPRATGLSALLEDGPTPLERLVSAATSRPDEPSTASAVCAGLLAVGSATGRLHAFVADGHADGLWTVRLHEGSVTALAALDLPLPADGATVPLVYSGGSDGTVRAWGPGAEPLATPVRSRPCPVTALAAANTETGPVLAIGWADGLVEHHALDDDGTVRTYRPGSPVRSLAATATGMLLVGTDDMMVCLRPA
ncbi:hypothetical protein ABZ484_30210 [Streptomyces sp. NPDC006393]|uniref:hypothetical protein n=1 Tax=Streptomyces sp. NPDC006393 TaxID=3156763 RepID=UPI0034013F43